MNVPAKNRDQQPTPATLEAVLIRGDLSQLTEAQRNEYYLRVCKTIGLNPLTRPFDYLTLNGKLVLYAKRDAADQLRKINGISVKIVSQAQRDGLLIVHASAKDRSGREDEDLGVVAFKGGSTDIAANSMMKAVTKAKRRVTLSISGLGFLDETETGDQQRDRPPTITTEQITRLRALARELDASMPDFLDWLSDRWEMDIAKVADIPASRYDDAIGQLELKRAALERLEKDAPRQDDGEPTGAREPA